MATVVGIGVHRGDIASLDESLLGFFDEGRVANRGAGKEAITVENLLRMNSGLQCVAEPTELTLIETMEQPDWLQYALDLPMAEGPGRSWAYCSPGVHLLSAIVQQAAGQSSHDYALKHLFEPLGFGELVWPTDPQGVSVGWGDVRMTPHDMARLAYLHLRQGRWDGQQVLPVDWVQAATSAPEGPQPGGSGYGYLWWLYPDRYSARGRGGQSIHVIPQEDMVVVTTGGGGSSWDTIETLLSSYLKPAIKSETALSPNGAGQAALQKALGRAAARPPQEPLPPAPLPAVAQSISGRVYQLEENPFNVQAMSLRFDQDDEALITITNSGYPSGDPLFAWRIGLDGVARFHPGRHEMPAAALGSWLSDGSFRFFVDEIGNNFRWQFTLRFEGSHLSGRWDDATAFFPSSIPLSGHYQ
jgi:CubicO group peptidase (beta-lactamase class C family)